MISFNYAQIINGRGIMGIRIDVVPRVVYQALCSQSKCDWEGELWLKESEATFEANLHYEHHEKLWKALRKEW